MPLDSGERQVAPDLNGVRRDHLARYEFAARILPAASRVIDVGCGIGYGTHILAQAGHDALGLDIDRDAIDYGARYFEARLQCRKAEEVGGYIPHDAAVCFEIIEHLDEPAQMLRDLPTATLLASVPNEAVFPFRGQAFHRRHYTKQQFDALLRSSGWRPVAWYGQRDAHSEVEPAVEGRTLVVRAVRANAIEIEAPELSAPQPLVFPPPPDLPVPHTVCILGLGPSVATYLDWTRRLGARHKLADEVWAINALGDILQCDRVWHLDDVRVQEARAAAKPDSNIAAMLGWLKKHPGPIYTSRPHPDYPGMVAFPLQDVVNSLDGHFYFNSTAAYAVAYAIHIGVKKMILMGMDFTYVHSGHAEAGRGSVEFWLGYATARGIEVSVPPTTTLLDAICKQNRLYGYDTVKVDLKGPNGAATATFTPLPEDEWPTAEEVERRYDHNLSANPIVRREQEAQQDDD